MISSTGLHTPRTLEICTTQTNFAPSSARLQKSPYLVLDLAELEHILIQYSFPLPASAKEQYRSDAPFQ